MKLSGIKLNNSGFTFIELLVVVAIIMAMTSIAFLGNKSINNGQKVKMSAQKLASDIRKMQSYVLNLQDHNGTFPDGGWGINIDNNTSYRLFADIDQIPANDEHIYSESSESSLLISLPGGIVIGDVDVDINTADPYSNTGIGNLNLSFSPPDPTTWICRNNAVQCGFKRAKIEVTNSDNSISKYVYINKYGLIDVQDN